MSRNRMFVVGVVAAVIVLLARAVEAGVIYATAFDTTDNVYKITADVTVTTFATLPSFPNGWRSTDRGTCLWRSGTRARSTRSRQPG